MNNTRKMQASGRADLADQVATEIDALDLAIRFIDPREKKECYNCEHYWDKKGYCCKVEMDVDDDYCCDSFIKG